MLSSPTAIDAVPGALGLTSPSNDREILLSARDGVAQAGRELVERHGPSMLRTAWRVLGRYGGNEADDVVQEAFVAALTTSALPTEDVGAWLRAIVARKALDWMRRLGRRRETSLPEPGVAGELESEDAGPAASLEVLTVRRALSQLRAMDRAVLVLADLEGLSMAEVADALGSTQVAVRLRASRARRKLARLLDDGERP